MLNNRSKIVVFDVDETLGYFVELGIFWDSLHNYATNKNVDIKKVFTQDYFNELLDLFPEFIRPNILTILRYVKLKKISKKCQNVIIYTNNQGPLEWVRYIKNYFESKLKFRLFDDVISAFKVNGVQIELCRTSHDKTINDLIKCSNIRDNVEICFLDDTYHSGMNADNVYYIKIKPYVYDLDFNLMTSRFLNGKCAKLLIKNKEDVEEFSEFIKNHINKYEFAYIKKNKEEYEIDKIVTKKTIMHLKSFFKGDNGTFFNETEHRKTKNKKIYKLKTRKNR